MSAVGAMAMPVNFRYREVFLKGKPRHDRWDPFRIKHPCMDRGKRAKIFAPFDALRGFDEAVSAKDVLYENQIALSEEDRDELNRRLEILYNLTYNSRMARANRVRVTVTYYEPCRDENHEAYGLRGQYRTVTGICLNVDADETKTILIGEEEGGERSTTAGEARPPAPRTPRAETRTRIRLEDILKIDSTVFAQQPVACGAIP